MFSSHNWINGHFMIRLGVVVVIVVDPNGQLEKNGQNDTNWTRMICLVAIKSDNNRSVYLFIYMAHTKRNSFRIGLFSPFHCLFSLFLSFIYVCVLSISIFANCFGRKSTNDATIGDAVSADPSNRTGSNQIELNDIRSQERRNV